MGQKKDPTTFYFGGEKWGHSWCCSVHSWFCAQRSLLELGLKKHRECQNLNLVQLYARQPPDGTRALCLPPPLFQGITPDPNQNFLLTLCSGITSGGAWATIWSARD